MDEATRIKYEKVNMAVQNISTRKKNLQDILSSFEAILNQTTNTEVLAGLAANELENKFNVLKRKFEAYIATVTEFESMITFAKNETQETEATIARAASDLAA